MVNFILPQLGDLFSATVTIALPVVILNKCIFFSIYLLNNNPCTIDTAWVISHFLVGIRYAIYFKSYETTGGKVALVLLSLWALRLGGFLFMRILAK